MGPVWCYWAFPMERYCGALGRANLNPRFPFVSLDRRVLEVAQLSQIKFMYNLTNTLDLNDRKDRIPTGTRYPGYPDLVFVRPKRTFRLDPMLTKQVGAYIGDLLDVDRKIVERQIKNHDFIRWGKMQQTMEDEAGDMISGFSMMPDTETPRRDTTFVKVSVCCLITEGKLTHLESSMSPNGTGATVCGPSVCLKAHMPTEGSSIFLLLMLT